MPPTDPHDAPSVPQKRRLSSPPDSTAPEAKRARKTTDDPADPSENAPPSAGPDARHAAKDRKKRRKKKRKQSVVAQDAGGESPAPEGPTPHARSPQKRRRAGAAQSTPGPSRPARSPSASPERVRTSAASSRTASEAPVIASGSEKGKARATSPGVSSAPAADVAALAAHRALLDSVLPSLTCQICLLLMSRPFALAPCGHVLCHGCLVNWWSNEPAVPLGQAVQQAEPPPAQAEGNEGANNNANNEGAAPAADPPAPAQRRAAPLIRRKKTCPHCRAVVREKPVEVWSIKDMVGAVVRSGLADPDSVPGEGAGADAAAAPWKDVFPDDTRGPFADMLRDSMGLRDEEDGGIYRCVDCNHEIWDGLCSSCGRFYPGHRVELDSDSADEDGLQPMWLDYSDDEDDEEADLEFLRRFMGGNYGGALPDEGGDRHSENGDHEPRWGWLGAAAASGSEGGHSEHGDDSDHSVRTDEEEDYESSFIDDDGDDVVEVSEVRNVGRQYRHGHESPIEVSSDDDIAEPRYALRRSRAQPGEQVDNGDSEDDDEQDDLQIWPRPLGRPIGGRILRSASRRVVLASSSGDEDSLSGEDDEEQDAPRSRYRLRSGAARGRYSDEETDDEGLAAEVAAREREMYGDDGSLPSRQLRDADSDDGEHYSDEDEY
ncbi:RING-type domain-containing protein [Phanerochaete sordida]|uniref:RING-type domain-containing protein n=1 Tax=Phanerochaete sordida TaxID=48140 RepID=A0A9P3G145_9APHY|nr:RING-type domain-containing protein [Phanerochaete sordida]